jgi:N-alpha-acetyltransferase 40
MMWQVPKRGKAHRKAVAQGKLVESANDLSTPDFMHKYGPEELLEHVHAGLVDGTSSDLNMRWSDGTNMEEKILDSCLDLVELTSAEHYRKSEMGWSRAKKRKEMVLPDLKFILFLKSPYASEPGAENAVLGFISFMITYEDGHEVVYVYEVHLLPEWQGKGLGRQLMGFVEAIARNVGVGKAMLTVFKANDRAVRGYEKLGYVEDDFSPGPRVLRNGAIKEPTYVILSKTLKDQAA